MDSASDASAGATTFAVAARLERLRSSCDASSIDIGGNAVTCLRSRPSGSASGSPLVLLPGAQGTAEIFVEQLLAWGAGRDLIAIDYPPAEDAAKMADAVVAAADTLGLDRFDLLGTSLGGFVAQLVAARHAARLGRLVLGNTFGDPAFAQSVEKRLALESRDAGVVKAEAMARLQAAPEGVLKQLQLALVGGRQSAESLRSRALALQVAAPAGPLGVADENILIVECDNDPLVPAPARAALRARHPDARVVVVAGGAHHPYVLRAERYNAEVGRFLEIDAPNSP